GPVPSNGVAPATTNATSISRNTAFDDTDQNATDFTAGAPTPANAGSDPTDPTDPIVTTIAQIQGTGAASPLVGQTVTTEGVVTAAYPS
ncbi:hypothetical protein ACC691_39160, partial [Rhizobium johnstonii]|uniref:hypothetical protein n=1 Tax=Rhizobium johnstonii TaxID=3019933 RepID=UPI003F9BCA44